MSKFKVGDKVRKVKEGTTAFPVGYEGEVTGFTSTLKGHIYVDNSLHSWEGNWELVEDKSKYPNGKHPHHDVIIEYAKGAEVEWFNSIYEKWCLTSHPSFGKNTLYRVKSQQDPAVQAAKKKIEQAEQMLREANDELDRLGL